MGFLPLGSLVQQVLGHLPGVDQIKTQLTNMVQSKANAQEGRSGAKAKAHTVLKAIENAMNPAVAADVEHRVAVGVALAEQAAVQAEAVPGRIRALAQAEAALERVRGTEGEATARTAREVAEANYVQAEINVVRAAIGDAPQA